MSQIKFFLPDPSQEPAGCKACNAVLSDAVINGVTGYFHMQASDDTHMPEPIPIQELDNPRFLFDFCLQNWPDEQLHTLYTKTIMFFSKGQIDNFSEDWALCPDCKILVDANDWEAMVERHVNLVAPMMQESKEVSRQNVKQLFELISKNLDRIE